MRRRGRILLGIGGLLLLLLVAAGGALAWLLTTTAGFDWALERARPYLPEGVTFVEAEGRLVGPIEVRGLRVADESTRTRVDRVRLNWRPRDLLGGRVHVDRLAVSGVDIEQAAVAESAADEGPALPSLPSDLGIPLSVTVDRLEIDDVTVRPPEGLPQRVDRLRARVEIGPEMLRVSQLSLAAPLLDAEGRLRLALHAPHGIDGRIDWRARPPGPLAAMAGQLALDGSLEDLELDQQWRRPASARVTANLQLFGDAPQWQARVELPRTMAPQWWATAPELGAAAYLSLDGSLEGASVSGTVDVAGLPVGPVRARLDARADAPARRLTLERVHVEPSRPGVWLEASGMAQLEGDTPRIDLDLAWRDLAWPLDTGDAVAASESGRLHLAGTPEDYRIEGAASAWTPAMGEDAAQLDWQGQGSLAGLDRLQLGADWRGARLQAGGEAQWAEAQQARFDVSVADVDPARFDPALAGRLRAQGSVRADWQDEIEAGLDLRELSGELNGRPVDGRARASWSGDRLQLQDVRLAAGDARLRASGGVGGDDLDLSWDLQIPRLAQLLPEAAGHIEGQGSISGDPAAATVRFEVNASGVRYADAALDAMALSGEIADSGRAASNIRLRVRGARAGGANVQRLAADLQGDRGQHALALRIEADRGQAVVDATGGLEGAQWRGRLEQAVLTPPRGAPWRLTAPAALAWEGQRFELAEACWAADGARACANGVGRPGDWQAMLEVADVPVGLVAGYWREDLEYDGRIDLSAQFAQDGGPVTGEARVELSPGQIAGTIGDTTTSLIEYGAGYLQATLAPERLDAKFELPLNGGGQIAATVGLGREAPQSLAGQARAEIRDLGLAAELVPQLGEVQGRLQADLRLDGTLDAPRLSGDANLTDGEASLPALGIDVRALEVSVATADRAVSMDLSADSGEGTLSASMELTHAPDRGWQGSGTVQGASFTAVDLAEMHANVTPDLEWRLNGREFAVNGRVVIPSARIEPRDLSNTVQSSPDAVIVEPGPPGGGQVALEDEEIEEIEGWRVSADVRVLIGENVRINAFGLDADLGGDIRIVQSPGQVTSATGELSVVEGTYTIYRQTLTIERGRVIFASGPLSDPGLDIRAVRRPRNVLVGVNVRGTLRQPRVELFSEPPMEESQVLSYLVVGVPLTETSSGERSSVAAAAAALASSRQGERLASELGIDEVTLEQEQDNEGASLVLGRYLSPRLYIGYGIGLLEQANSVRVRYELSRRWTVETESGATSSADLLYSIESD